MSTAPILAETPAALQPAYRRTFAAGVGVCTVAWFLTLSAWFGLRPGSILLTRPNILFSSDTNAWIERFGGETRLPRVFPYHYVHPLEVELWRPPCRAIGHLLKLFLSQDEADVLSARLLTAILFGVGTAALSFLGLSKGLDKTRCVMLLAIYMLFTSSATAVLPEHFAISNGLLSLAFVAPFFIGAERIKYGVLAALTLLAGGTIITNFAFPLGSLIRAYSAARRFRWRLIVLPAAGAAAVSAGFYVFSYSVHWFVSRYLNARLFHAPWKAAEYTLGMVLVPVVGPMPQVHRFPGFDQVSFEPLRLGDYSWIQAIAAAAWLVLLIRSVGKALEEKRLRPEVWMLLGWLAYEALVHNMWGDEFLLFAPDWTWALAALVVLGAPYLSRLFVGAMAALIATGQVYTLLAIRAAFLTIHQ
ncbi:MAG TPA: hypothetical protein VIY49_12970 [Bryobacteraceae bacterium]